MKYVLKVLRALYGALIGGIVFGGMVLVREGAAKADAYQEDKNLLLSDKAEVDSKPSLEIYAPSSLTW